MTAAEIERRLDDLRAEAKPLNDQIAALERDLMYAQSREWIAANGVTREMVCDPNADGMPYFNTAGEFMRWLQRQPTRLPYSAWNTRIFPTSEILEGRLDWGRFPGRLDDLPGGGK